MAITSNSRNTVRLTRKELLHYVSRLEKLLGSTNISQVVASVRQDWGDTVSSWNVREGVQRLIAEGLVLRDEKSYALYVNPRPAKEEKLAPDMDDLPRLRTQ